MRIYDPRLGKSLSVDPIAKKYPFYSPYHFAGNSPIAAIDLDGAEPVGFSCVKNNNGYNWQSSESYGQVEINVGGTKKRGELSKIVDANKIASFVVTSSTMETAQTSFGPITMAKKEYFYFTKPPSKNKEDYAGGEWQGFESEGQIAAHQMQTLARNTSIGVFGLGATAVAAPFIAGTSSLLSGTFVGKGLASTAYDGIGQLATNGWNFNKLNATELTASFFIQGSSLKSLFANNAIGNLFEANAGEGYIGIGSDKFDWRAASIKTLIGTAVDLGFEGLKNLPVGSKVELGRWENLSYKPKFAEMLRISQRNASVNGFFASPTGQIVGETTSSAATNSTETNDKKSN